MAVSFPVPKAITPPIRDLIGDSSNHMPHTEYTLDNPHPGFGKDPNILNYLGHTKYPKMVKNKIGDNVVVKNEEEENEALGKEVELRDDGPTIQEYVAAGFKAKDYPPKGYASKSTETEIKAMIDAASGWGANK